MHQYDKEMKNEDEIMAIILKKKVKSQQNLIEWGDEDIRDIYEPFSLFVSYFDVALSHEKHRFLVLYGKFLVSRFMMQYLKAYKRIVQEKNSINILPFRNAISNIKEEKIVGGQIPVDVEWAYDEFLAKYEEIINNLCIGDFQDILRLKRVGDNTIHRMEQNSKSLPCLIELFYQYYDKLKANNYIKQDYYACRKMLEFYKKHQESKKEKIQKEIFKITLSENAVIYREETISIVNTLETAHKHRGENICLKKSYI